MAVAKTGTATNSLNPRLKVADTARLYVFVADTARLYVFQTCKAKTLPRNRPGKPALRFYQFPGMLAFASALDRVPPIAYNHLNCGYGSFEVQPYSVSSYSCDRPTISACLQIPRRSSDEPTHLQNAPLA